MDSKNGKTEDKTTDDEDAKQESTIEISNIMEEDERFKEDLLIELDRLRNPKICWLIFITREVMKVSRMEKQ